MSYQSNRLREIADQYLARGSKDWAELMQISGYIEGLEEGRDLLKGANRPAPTETGPKHCPRCEEPCPTACDGEGCPMA